VIESLPSKCEALNENPSTAKKKERKKKRKDCVNIISSEVLWSLVFVSKSL
jgi:hypothetical protein